MMGGYLKTVVLLAALTALFGAVGLAIAGEQGMLLALLLAGVMNLFAWWNSDRMVLAMYRAEPIGPEVAPRLYHLTARLAARAGLPLPALYLIHEDQPNAFATGRNPAHAAVAVTSGLLNLLPEEEVEAVIAHELAHIRNRDTLIMTVTATIAGAISLLAHFGLLFGSGRDRQHSPFGPIGLVLMVILAPLAAALVQMAISRSREYAADRAAAELTGQPLALASALARLEAHVQACENPTAEAHPATAHLFIVNPLSGARLDNLFSTHPRTENRIAALQRLAEQWGLRRARPSISAELHGPGRKPWRNPWG